MSLWPLISACSFADRERVSGIIARASITIVVYYFNGRAIQIVATTVHTISMITLPY